MTGTEVDGLSETERALSRLAWHVVRDTNKAMGRYADDVAQRAAKHANQVGGVARLAAHGLTTRKSGGGELTAGGSGRPPTGRGSYSDLFFGAEFGGGSRPETRQFKPWKPDGYWFYPAVREAYQTSLDDAIDVLEIDAVKVWVS